MTDILIGRQPIFGQKKDVIGYELLYRSVTSPQGGVILDGDLATTRVILNTFSEIGLDNLVYGHKAFINATRNFLIGHYPIPFAPEHVVLEVLEDIPIDNQLIESLKELSHQGYLIALDDVESIERIYPLLGIANIIKIDLTLVDKNGLGQVVNFLKQYQLQLLAEKVETLEEFEQCRHLGFDYFQGYFLEKPEVFRQRAMDSLRLVIMQFLATIQNPDVNFSKIEEIISKDVSLGYKLLRLVNSAYFSTTVSVTSIRQAISLIGFEQLRSWMTLLLMTSINDKPHELSIIAMTRAKMSELLAKALHKEPVDRYFMMGLLSVLDALMDMPMKKALAFLPLSSNIVEALLYHRGECAQILNTVIAYEQGEWDTVLKVGLPPDIIQKIYLQSIHWADKILKSIKKSEENITVPGGLS